MVVNCNVSLYEDLRVSFMFRSVVWFRSYAMFLERKPLRLVPSIVGCERIHWAFCVHDGMVGNHLIATL